MTVLKPEHIIDLEQYMVLPSYEIGQITCMPGKLQ